MSSRKHYSFLSLRALRAFVVNGRSGLSLVELLIAIGILAISMMLIAAAFPAGVAMSIAVSDETTAQSVFQKAVAEIVDNVGIGDFTPDADNNLIILPDGSCERDFGNSPFSWSALIRPVDDTASGAMRNLCQVIVVVSRQPSGSPDFLDDGDGGSTIPELRSVTCTGVLDERKLTITSGFERLPSAGYIIDSETGAVYSIISRNPAAGVNPDNVTLLTPLPADISTARPFWVVPGPQSGGEYGLSSPAVRVFGAMLYLP